jgi:hypothetical protein
MFARSPSTTPDGQRTHFARTKIYVKNCDVQEKVKEEIFFVVVKEDIVTVPTTTTSLPKKEKKILEGRPEIQFEEGRQEEHREEPDHVPHDDPQEAAHVVHHHLQREDHQEAAHVGHHHLQCADLGRLAGANVERYSEMQRQFGRSPAKMHSVRGTSENYRIKKKLLTSSPKPNMKKISALKTLFEPGHFKKTSDVLIEVTQKNTCTNPLLLPGLNPLSQE